MIQDEDEFGGPDLDEMQTTTQRNRGRGGRKMGRGGGNVPPGPVAPMPKRARSSQPKRMHEEQPDEGDNPFEGTAPLKKTRDSGSKDDGQKGHHGIAIIIQPMSNPLEERRQSIRSDINKAIKTEKRRGPR